MPNLTGCSHHRVHVACDGRKSERGRACTHNLHQAGLILPSWWNVHQKVAIATLCTLWLPHPTQPNRTVRVPSIPVSSLQRTAFSLDVNSELSEKIITLFSIKKSTFQPNWFLAGLFNFHLYQSTGSPPPPHPRHCWLDELIKILMES